MNPVEGAESSRVRGAGQRSRTSDSSTKPLKGKGAMTSEQPRLEQLLDATANIELFVLFMTATAAFEVPLASQEARRILTDHLVYLRELERSGQLYASGPLDTDGDGMCIVRTPSREHAERIGDAEPFHQAGWRINTVRSWHLNEGLLVASAKELTSS